MTNDTRVSRLVLESRPPTLIGKDRSTIDALRGRNALRNGIRVGHCLPLEEPMLWIADQVLGAVGESLAKDPTWLEVIASAVDVIRIDL